MRKIKALFFKYLALLRALFYKKRLLNLVIVISYFLLKKTKLTGFPFVLQIEPTNRCNLNCALCLTGAGKLKRYKGDMTFQSFKDIIQQFEDKIIYLALYNLGESLLNKEIYQMIEYAKRKRIYIRLSTSGDFPETEIKKLIDSNIDELIISLDCATAQTYLKYKGKDTFKIVISNVQSIVRERGDASRPFLNLQLLVMKDTENEIPRFKELQRYLNVDRGLIKKIRVNFPGIPADKTFFPSNKRYIRAFYRNNNKNGLCYRPWVSSVILWDGNIVPCCFDMEGEYTFGNVLNENFRQIWHSNRYRLFRENILQTNEQNSICRECSISGFLQDLTVFM